MSIEKFLILIYTYPEVVNMEKKDDRSLIVKSNKLVEAKYKLTGGEQKIIYKLTSAIKKDDTDFKEYVFKIAEFMDMLGVKDKSKYSEIPKITKGLMKKVFSIYDEQGELQISWLSSVRYLKGSGEVILKFDPALKPLLLQLKSGFTRFEIHNVMKLRSFYSMRMYELLKQYLTIGERKFDLSYLREILGIEDNEYQLYADFKRFVIKQAQKEINNKTDIHFEFEEIKSGRKVTTLHFIIRSNKATLDTSIEDSEEDIETDNKLNLVKTIIQESITNLEAASILQAAKNDIDIIKKKYEIAKVSNNINNIVSWMKDAIKNDYQMPKGKGTKTFSQYDQRSYNFNELEKKLLGYDEAAAE